MKNLFKKSGTSLALAASAIGLGGAAVSTIAASSADAATYHWYYYGSSSDKDCNKVSNKTDISHHKDVMWTRENFYRYNTFLGIRTGGVHLTHCQIFYRATTPYAGGKVWSNGVAYTEWKESPNMASNYNADVHMS